MAKEAELWLRAMEIDLVRVQMGATRPLAGPLLWMMLRKEEASE